jgi:hypothetical protein
VWPLFDRWMWSHKQYLVRMIVGKGDRRILDKKFSEFAGRKATTPFTITTDESVTVWITSTDDVAIGGNEARSQILVENELAFWEWKVTPQFLMGPMILRVHHSVNFKNPRTGELLPKTYVPQELKIYVVPNIGAGLLWVIKNGWYVIWPLVTPTFVPWRKSWLRKKYSNWCRRIRHKKQSLRSKSITEHS